MTTEKVQAVTYITAEDHKAIRLEAADLRVSVAELLRRIIREHLSPQK